MRSKTLPNHSKSFSIVTEHYEITSRKSTVQRLSVSKRLFEGVVESHGRNFGSIAYRIPANNKGDSIRLEGYMKIKNVENTDPGLKVMTTLGKS